MVDENNYWTRRVTRRSMLRAVGLGAAGLAGAALIGCGDDDDEPTTSRAATGTSATAAPVASGPSGKATISLSGGGTQNYDPAGAGGLAEIFTNTAIGEALAIMGPVTTNGVPTKNTYIPAVAQSWETSADGMEWVFKLRPGVKAHDGSTLTAEDVKYSLERFLDPANESTSGASLVTRLDHMEVIGDDLKFVLARPAAFLPTQANFYIYPRAAVEAVGVDKFGDHPIGAGPFKFVSARHDVGTTMEAFTDHYRKVPSIKTLELLISPEVTTRLAALKAGETDVMLKPSGPSIPDILADSNLTLHEGESSSMNDIQFLDMSTAETRVDTPWADLRMRQAVAHAVDIGSMIEKIYFDRAVAVSVPGAVPGLPGVPDLPVRAYDPAKAKSLIAAAGYDGLEFDIVTYNSGAQGGNPDCAAAVSTNLNAVGFKSQAKPVEYASFFENRKGGTWAGTGTLSVQVVGGRASESFFGKVNPDSAYKSWWDLELAAEAERLYTLFGEELAAATNALAQKFYDQVVTVPLVSQNYIQGYGPRIKAWEPHMRAGFELGMEYIELV